MSKTHFSYDPDNGFQLHDTAESAKKDAETALAHYRKEASFDGEWPQQSNDVCWGALRQRTTATGDEDEGYQVDLVDVSAAAITIDFKMATELLEMFGGEPCTVTLQVGGDDCHSGPGVYVFYEELREEGSHFLGQPEEDATP